jgi:hypothetical protein
VGEEREVEENGGEEREDKETNGCFLTVILMTQKEHQDSIL